MAPTPTPIGNLREHLTIQENVPDAISVTSLTRASTTATATTAAAHGYLTGDFVRVAGATPSGYNGTWKITVASPTTFTFTVSGVLATPATGTITGLYVSDAQGGRKIGWATLATAPTGVWAEFLPQRAAERLQAQALSSQIDYRFRVRTRSDLTAQQRALWAPSWHSADVHTLEIHGVLPDGDGRGWLILETGEVR
jgi:head-tail adaptor